MRLRAGDPESIGGYRLTARLGTGGMGTVFLAQTSSGRAIAIKLIHQQFLHDDEFRTRFRQEVAAARRVSGAFTAAVVDADPDGDHPWMATTYISGPTLAQRISADGALRGAELRTLAIGLVEALRDIHRAGVVHRDLKPSNVVLSPDGPRVIDFGISRAPDQQTLTMTGRVIGTPPFMSPEQLQAPREVGTESDVFSVATLLVYAATGQGPFDADSPYMTAYQVVHEAPVLYRVPDPLRAVVEPCLAKDRGERPSADELLRQLRALPDDLAPPPGGTAAADAGRPGTEPAGGPEPAADGAETGMDFVTDLFTRSLDDRTKDARTTDGGGRGPGDRPVVPACPATTGPARHGESTSGTDTDPGAEAVVGVTGVADPVHGGALSEVRHGHQPAFSARGLRRRWRTVVAVAAAVAAISTGVAVISSGGGEREKAAGGGAAGAGAAGAGKPSSAARPLPQGFRPWQKRVPGARNIPDELRCVVHDESAYCGGGGVLAVRLQLADGTQTWKRTSPGVPEQGLHMVGAADGAVVGYRLDDANRKPVRMVALSTADGTELWSARLADSAAFTGRPQNATLLGGTVFSVDADSTRFEARRVRTGALRWSTPFPAGSRCIPWVAGKHAYAMCAPVSEVTTLDIAHPDFRTLDPATGRLGRPVRAHGHLVPMGTAQDGSLVALQAHMTGAAYDGYTHLVRVDPRSGRVASVPIGHRSSVAPGMAGGTLYLPGEDGVIHAIDPMTGKEKWTVQTSVESASGPELAHGVLYFGAASGRVVAVDERTGRLRWSTNPRTTSPGVEIGATSRVAVAGGAVVVTAHGNLVFSFSAAKPPKAS